jgi:HSP20 family protein
MPEPRVRSSMPDREDPFSEIEQVLDVLTGGLDAGGDVPVDLRATDDGYELVADLPGYDADSIDVRVADGRRVTISAERSSETETESEDYVVRERERRTVSRTVTVPEPVEESAAAASFDAGVLTVSLPRLAEAGEGTDIPVN